MTFGECQTRFFRNIVSSELFDGKGMALFSLALSPASRELPQRGSLWKTVVGKGFLLKNGTKGSPFG